MFVPSSPPHADEPAARPPYLRRRAAFTIGAVVLSLHVLALDAAVAAHVDAAPARAPSALSVRWIEAIAQPADAFTDTAVAPLVAPAPLPSPKAKPVQRARLEMPHRQPVEVNGSQLALAAPQTASAPPEPTETLGNPADSFPPPAVDASAHPSAPPAPAASSPIAPEAPVPVYKTRMAPASTLHYELRRGGITGTGDLQWRPADKAYELRLDGKVAGITLLSQVSQGQIDAHGLAPVRFTDQRTRRAVQAANFQRDKGIITFSGPADQYLLVPGVQDRLSWMLQLGAIVSAEPTRARPGQKVSLYVVGSRGEVDTWVMDFVGVESVQANGGSVKALKFMREARKPMDSHIEIWLDPTHHHLPVHAKQSTGADGSGDVFELLLKEIDPTP